MSFTGPRDLISELGGRACVRAGYPCLLRPLIRSDQQSSVPVPPLTKSSIRSVHAPLARVPSMTLRGKPSGWTVAAQGETIWPGCTITPLVESETKLPVSSLNVVGIPEQSEAPAP